MSTDTPQRDLLDPDTVNRASALGLFARKVVEGYKVGEHRSPLKGFAIEFAQHREYAPGDDVRHMDWKILGRTDRLFIKQYEQDTNYIAHVLMDCSGSMNFASEKLSKFHFSKVITACLAHVILHQRDAISVGFIGNDAPTLLPRTDTPNKMPWLMESLAKAEAGGRSNIGEDLLKLAPAIKRRSIIIIISDLLQDEDALFAALPRFRYQESEVILFHVLDHAELELPYADKVRFEGLEGEEALTTQPEDFAAAYRKEVADYCVKMRRSCESHDAHYVLIDTSKPLSEALGEYLSFRRRVHR
jgi:Uncharacterized conserved protein (some members contain a von Willebrand factor type A (vWA) domain)